MQIRLLPSGGCATSVRGCWVDRLQVPVVTVDRGWGAIAQPASVSPTIAASAIAMILVLGFMCVLP